MSFYKIQITSTRERAMIEIENNGFAGDLSCITPFEVILKMVEVFNQFSSIEPVELNTEEEPEEVVDEEIEEEIEEEAAALVKPKKPKVEAPKAEAIMDGEKYLTTAEVAERIGKTGAMISWMVGQGQFPKADKKVGIKNMWRQEAVENWLYEQNPDEEDADKEVLLEEEDFENDNSDIVGKI